MSTKALRHGDPDGRRLLGLKGHSPEAEAKDRRAAIMSMSQRTLCYGTQFTIQDLQLEFLQKTSGRALTAVFSRGQHDIVAAKLATGICSPNCCKAHQRPSSDARRFLFWPVASTMGVFSLVLWRAVHGGRKACRLPYSGLQTVYRPPLRIAARWRISRLK